MEDQFKPYVRSSGFILWFTGLSGSGKSTLSTAVSAELKAKGLLVELLDGDEVRTHLSAGLTFSKEHRDINVRRIGYVARLLARNGVVAITAAISPYREIREEVRQEAQTDGSVFIEVYVRCAIETLAARDVKGLYKRALAGEIQNFTGITDPYEQPLQAEVTVDSGTQSIEESLDEILSYLKSRSLIS